nr:uncharacterized protein LOC109161799 isoform X3 [Ipomoea batatas]GME21249.1 uncharacterized protein LOC109161799 isoform X3 [Ipomoea batatas]
MKFYALSSGIVNHLLSDNHGEEIDIPFEVTDEEKELIQSGRSSFILGRSGTGKTTVLTMKLIQKEQLHQLALGGVMRVETNEISKYAGESSFSRAEIAMMSQSEAEAKKPTLRQLFVTVSPKLCFAVKKQVSNLKCFVDGGKFSAGNSVMDMDDLDGFSHFKDIPNSFVGIPDSKYPLVITFHKFLMMLDGTLWPSYFDRFHDTSTLSLNRISRSVTLDTFIRGKEVSFDRFCCLYWPHFNSELSKNLDPSRVFTEIISHIKGGLQVCETDGAKLTRERYISMSANRVSTVNEKKRGEIYDIFLDYEKMKMKRGEFDLSDLVSENLNGDKMDFVYIDEVQDLTMRQISLFKHICKNVDEGFVFSGDTAQTIARGVDFRFEDVRTLFYEEFIMKLKGDGLPARKDKGHLAGVSCLLQNFRTHAGVLRLAQSVIDILYHYFPLSIDALAPETSLIYGEAPVLLKPGSDENAIVTIFGNSGSMSGKMVGFGAEQVILVRDEAAKKEVSDFVGKQALILTIVECKGLEFQDVMLYNFIGSSPLRNHWRIVYEYMKQRDLLDSEFHQCFPCFSEARHAILCSELKQLYVAITRTRQRLWIYESVEEFSKPMFDYWMKMCLVEVREVDDSLAQAMRMASTPEQWKSRGIKLFWDKQYEMAIMCFERAGESKWEKRAKASRIREAAYRKRDSKPIEFYTSLRQAAEIFESIGRFESAAECYCDLNEYELAGSIYLNKCGEQEHEKAAECYTLARCYETAAKIYARQNCFSECLSVCSKGRHLYDMGLEYVEYWKQHAQERRKEIDGIEQKFLESCASDFFKCNDKKSMVKFVKAFKTLDHMRMFLKPRDCLDELLWLEEESGNYAEAAELAQLKGDLQREVVLLAKAGNFSKASSRILWYVLANSLWVCGCWAAWPLKSFESKHELLKKAISFASNESDAFYESVCTEARILSHDPSSLCELRRTLSATHKCGSLRGEILCLRKIIDVHTQIDVTKYKWEEKFPVDLKYPDDTLFCDQLSVGTLCHFWNLWRRNILDVFESLKCLEVQKDFGKYKGYGEFCLNYFGVRRQFTDMKVTYLLSNPDAEWVKEVHQSFLSKSKNMVSVDVRHLIIAARNYWQNEVFSVGLKVLETLESLYGFSTKLLSQFSQSMFLVNIYVIAKDLHCQKYDAKLQKFFQLSSMQFFVKVFPLDYQEALEENIISLRGTEVSRSLLEEFIVNDLSGKGKLTLGQIGRLMMIWLGSAQPSDELCHKIFERIRDGSNWKAFINILRSVREPLNQSASADSQEASSVDPYNLLVRRFHEALNETYQINWQNFEDYISPHCFVYLVERFLILSFCPSGFFYTTKSSFLEWLIFQNPGVSVIAGFQTSCPSSEIFYNSVTSMVHWLLFHNLETAHWIARSKIQSSNYHKLLVLRLVVILCLLCMNSSSQEPWIALFDALKSPYITSELPREFNKVFRRGGKHTAFVDRVKIAEALRVIGNPALFVDFKQNTASSVCPNATYLGIGPNSCRADIMEMLFPRKSVTSPVQKSMKNSCCLLPLIADLDIETSVLPSPDDASAQN